MAASYIIHQISTKSGGFIVAHIEVDAIFEHEKRPILFYCEHTHKLARWAV